MAQAMEGVAWMEKENGKKFGDLKNPLLVSVRSGARASMPGMMDTILNLGLNDDVVAAMIAVNPDPKFERFVYDSYRRFIQMFSDVVMEVGKKYFEQLIDKMCIRDRHNFVHRLFHYVILTFYYVFSDPPKGRI